MGLTQVHVDAVAGAGPFPNQGSKASGCDGDADAGGVGDAPAGLLVPARASGTDGAFCLGNAADGDGLALPAVKTKDPVGFRDYLPTLQIAHLAAALLPLADFGPIKRSGSPPERRAAAGPNEEPRDDCWCWTHWRKERRLSWRWEAMEREEERSEIESARKGPPLQRRLSS
jgi:hypothetical protein